MKSIQGYAVTEAGSKLEPYEYEIGELAPTEVDVKVTSCGLCHSDLSMAKNDWGMSDYPFIPGHEITGVVEDVGESVTHLKPGDQVGIGWSSYSCGVCQLCLAGDHNLCPDTQATIVGRNGGFANAVRAQAAWTIKIPDSVDLLKAGPLFCGGITVFNPMVQFDVKPTDRVAVVGIGGLGHMALQFLSKWGCEVTAISTSPDKEEHARTLGAHHFLNARDEDMLKKTAARFDFILSTVNVPLPWDLYLNMLRPKGHFHMVGASEEIKATIFPLLIAQRSIAATPTGAPATIATMLDFCGRHGIAPKTREFPMSEVNDALTYLEKHSPAERMVLLNE